MNPFKVVWIVLSMDKFDKSAYFLLKLEMDWEWGSDVPSIDEILKKWSGLSQILSYYYLFGNFKLI